MRRQGAELSDEDLERLARLGGAPGQIAEAAGIDVAQVLQRLAGAQHASGSKDLGLAPVAGALC